MGQSGVMVESGEAASSPSSCEVVVVGGERLILLEWHYEGSLSSRGVVEPLVWRRSTGDISFPLTV